MATPKTDLITCPSGLVGEIRNLQGQDGNVLMDRRIAKQGRLVDEILRRCWLRTAEPGLAHYASIGAGPDWSKVLAGDRMFIFVRTRVLTFGPSYVFRPQCSVQTCRRTFDWEIDLDAMTVKSLTEEAAKVFCGSNRFEATIPSDGRGFVFKLMTGADERKALKLLEDNQDSRLTTSLATRIIGIEGIEPRNVHGELLAMSLSDHNDLLHIIEESDCGLETAIEVECPFCQNDFEVEIPFSAEFFSPKPKRQKATSPPASAA